ncbi:MAG: class I SAM-dependent methyltransferase, partial [Vicinamibacterales bacterium]
HHLGQRILDAGCGPGHVTQYLVDDRELVIGLDRSPQFQHDVTKRFAAYVNFRPMMGDLTDPTLPDILKPYALDTIVCVNVLHTLKDDMSVLAGFHHALAAGGTLILFVAALPALYGTADEADGAVRRYSREEITSRLARSGFVDLDIRWMNLVGIPGWFLNGKILRNAIVPESHYALYERLVPLLRSVEARVRLPIGLSLLCVGHKGRAS